MGGVAGPNLRCRILRCIQSSIARFTAISYSELLQLAHETTSRLRSSVLGVDSFCQGLAIQELEVQDFL